MCLFRISFPIRENARFRGWERKNEYSVHKKNRFYGRGPGYLLYLYDVFENTN